MKALKKLDILSKKDKLQYLFCQFVGNLILNSNPTLETIFILDF